MFCSIIIPLYNKAGFITAAIQSVLNQSHQNFEIIVVDDGSTDDGALIVRAIHDHRIKLIQQANSGVSCARNQGIDLAKGELVCFLDADDWYLPSYLETIISMAFRYPEIAFFATYYKRVSIDSLNKIGMSWNPGDTHTIELIDNFFHRWRLGSLFVTNSVAIRRLHLTQFKPYFPLNEQWAEDQDLWFRLAEKSPLAYCPAPLVGYRMEVNGSLCAINEPRSSVMSACYLRLEQRALDPQFPDKHRNSALKLVAESKITLARNALMEGRRYDAFIQLLNTWHGLLSKRWWVSLMMCLVGSPVFVSRWENWRLQRTRNW
ncbi:glycosyltransferase [Methylobacter sp. G7]|uniref:glycosyltransferase family 2 protein n=1 Tax=Methylobacter sp. G7 TaxID=3230117 RepID=UPI003D80227E